MAVTKIVKELDSKLMEDGTISKEFEADYQKVHKMLNTFVKQTGGQVTAENFKKGEDMSPNKCIKSRKSGCGLQTRTAANGLSMRFVAQKNRRLNCIKINLRLWLFQLGSNQ